MHARRLQGGKVAEGTVMAADPALSLPRIQEAARAFLALVSDPVFLPEFEHLQVPQLRYQEHRPMQLEPEATAHVIRVLSKPEMCAHDAAARV